MTFSIEASLSLKRWSSNILDYMSLSIIKLLIYLVDTVIKLLESSIVILSLSFMNK